MQVCWSLLLEEITSSNITQNTTFHTIHHSIITVLKYWLIKSLNVKAPAITKKSDNLLQTTNEF